MLLSKKEFAKKEYIKLNKRLEQIWKKKRSITWRKVEKPFQDGWNLTIGLRDDLLRSSRGPLISSIINRYNESYVTRQVGKIKEIRENSSLLRVEKLFLGRYWKHSICSIRILSESEYRVLPEGVKKYFTRTTEEITPKWGMEGYTRVYYMFNIPKHYLVVKISKRMVTHVQDIDPELLKEQAYIEAKLEPYYRTAPGQGSYRFYDQYYTNRADRRASKIAMKKELVEASGDVIEYFISRLL